MYPHERSLVKRMKDKPFAIVGVNSDKSLEVLHKVLEKKQITWPSFFDGGGTGGPIATKWGVRGWPTIYVIDEEGIIRNRGARGKRLDVVVDDLMQKLETKARTKTKTGGVR